MSILGRPALGLITAVIPTLACTFSASAQESDRAADVKALGHCEDCVFDKQDFSDRRLTGINFASAQQSETVFDRVAMNIAIFDGATLHGASFVSARLGNVNFDDVDLSGAVFEGAVLERTDIQSARLCNTQLPGDIMDMSDCT